MNIDEISSALPELDWERATYQYRESHKQYGPHYRVHAPVKGTDCYADIRFHQNEKVSGSAPGGQGRAANITVTDEEVDNLLREHLGNKSAVKRETGTSWKQVNARFNALHDELLELKAQAKAQTKQEPEEEPADDSSLDYEAYSKKELQQAAKSYQLERWSKMTKAELVEAIRHHEREVAEAA